MQSSKEENSIRNDLAEIHVGNLFIEDQGNYVGRLVQLKLVNVWIVHCPKVMLTSDIDIHCDGVTMTTNPSGNQSM